MILVRFVRRFRVAGRLVERARVFECPAPPPKGTQVDFGDGTAPAVVAFLKMQVRSVEWTPGVYGCAYEAHTESEDVARLAAVDGAGWKPAE